MSWWKRERHRCDDEVMDGCREAERLGRPVLIECACGRSYLCEADRARPYGSVRGRWFR